MPRAVLLACPICDSVRAVEGRQTDYSKEDLFPTVKDHLRSHRITESKAAIRKHQIAEETVELIVQADEFENLPVGEWQDQTAARLPEGAVSGAGGSSRQPESSVESVPPRSNTGD